MNLDSLDHRAFAWINQWVGHFPWLDALTRLLVNEYFVPVGMSLGLLFLWFGGNRPEERDRWQRAVLVAILAVGIANVIVKASNLVYFRPRPFHDAVVRMLFYRPIDSSFPSNGTAVTFAIATAVWLLDRRASPIFWILAVAFPLARLFAGVHYPSDILAGAALGILSAVAANVVLRQLDSPLGTLLLALRRSGMA